jgi:hypothetical protein
MSGDISVRFIALSIEFDTTQGPVHGQIAGSIPKMQPQFSVVRGSRYDKLVAALRCFQRRNCYNVE